MQCPRISEKLEHVSTYYTFSGQEKGCKKKTNISGESILLVQNNLFSSK